MCRHDAAGRAAGCSRVRFGAARFDANLLDLNGEQEREKKEGKSDDVTCL